MLPTPTSTAVSLPRPHASSLYATLFPTAEPLITSDPWQCATEKISQYFSPPKPTGTVLVALLSYASALLGNCTVTANPTGLIAPRCPFPAKDEWCAFTTAAPPSILPGYWSYASSASSWWSQMSKTAVELAGICPNTWFEAMIFTPGGDVWLNDTIIFSQCYVEGYFPTAAPSTIHIVASTATTAI